jgi:MFS family permease
MKPDSNVLTSPVLEETTTDHLAHDDGYRAVLRNRNFLALWVGQVFSQLADRIVFVVFITMIVSHYGSNESYNSYLYVAFTIPAILLTAIAGVFVDRWPRRLLLVSTNVLRAALMAFLPWTVDQGLLAVYALAFALSSATQFFVPAEAATIPTIVKKNQLLTANSLFTTTMIASVIFGFALGDPLINMFRLESVHWAISVLFLLASASLMFVNVPPPPCATGDCSSDLPDLVSSTVSPRVLEGSFAKFFGEIKEGVAYIWKERLILQAMLKLAMLFSAMVALCILFIGFAKAFLYDDPKVAAQKFAYIITYCGIGMILGAIAVGHPLRKAPRSLLVFSGFTLIGLCLLALTQTGFISKTWQVFTIPEFSSGVLYLQAIHITLRMLYTYGLATLMGIGATLIAIPLQAVLHELIPEELRGKILGVQFTILSTCSTVPVLIAGLGAESVGVTWMFALIGLPMLLLGIYGLINRLKPAYAAPPNW